jgi:murein DD-endopeptidase MepM/ murein hydrolase activator NlpD
MLMKQPKLSEKGRIAYLCVAFIVLAISITLWKNAGVFSSQIQNRNEITTAERTSVTSTEPLTVIDAGNPVTNVPDTRESETETTVLFTPLDKFVWPLKGGILHQFSGEALVKNETTGDWRTHNGTDIAGEAGSEIRAVNNGVVTASYTDALWGAVVVIDHGNNVTAKYCGLSPVGAVEKGEVVSAGQIIGQLGSIPVEGKDKPHLHFEMRSGGVLINPMDLLE